MFYTTLEKKIMCNLDCKNKELFIILELLLLFKTFACDFDETMNRVLVSYKDCIDYNKTEFWTCLENESVSILNRVERLSVSIPLVGNTVELIRDSSIKDTDFTKLASRQTLSKNRARYLSAGYVDYSIMRAIMNFFKNRSLQIKIPIFRAGMFRNFDVEGRGKKDKGNNMLAGCLLIGLMMTIGSLAMLSGKALMTSLIALTLAALSQRNRGGHGHAGLTHGATTYEVINVPAHHHH